MHADIFPRAASREDGIRSIAFLICVRNPLPPTASVYPSSNTAASGFKGATVSPPATVFSVRPVMRCMLIRAFGTIPFLARTAHTSRPTVSTRVKGSPGWCKNGSFIIPREQQAIILTTHATLGCRERGLPARHFGGL